ncbi:MAG: hypothetical protein KAV00_06135 [Phycisphaerae bacterium]|nr:hypothetical protein [Phycisphaerae bacterium]
MWDKLGKQITVNCEELSLLLDSVGSLFNDVSSGREPTPTETFALASVLNSFYNGVENIFKRIAVLIDGGCPRGGSWHTELISSMVKPTSGRSAVISEDMLQRLKGYMDFRHFYVHAYTYELDWDLMAPLVLGCKETLHLLEAELNEFLKH